MKFFEGSKVPIKSWCNEPEDGAIIQAKNLSDLPFIFKHVALMPDCLTEDTEILTNKGFKLISSLTYEDLVAEVDFDLAQLDKESVRFSKPKDIIIREQKQEEYIDEYFLSTFERRIRVTNKHRMPYITNPGISSETVPLITQTKDFLFGTVGTMGTLDDLSIPDQIIQLVAWVVGDGNIKTTKNKNSTCSVIRWGLKKERKIKRLVDILNCCQLKYYLHQRKHQTEISLCKGDSDKIIEIVTFKKEYPKEWIYKLSKRQAILFLDEALKVDGDYANYIKYNTQVYNTKRESDENFFSSLIALHLGVSNTHRRANGMYKITAIPASSLTESNSGVHLNKIIKQPHTQYVGKVVCVTTNTGYFIAKQGGLTFVTGNCHAGYGMPIGGVIACKDAIIPNAVGVDIGCGMSVLKTDLTRLDTNTLKEILGKIREDIPVGFSHHKADREWSRFAEAPDLEVIQRELPAAKKQLGTLGGGNHFIEVQMGNDGHIWVMLHSGSRNFGLKVAKHYNKIAQDLCDRWFSSIPKSKGENGLAFLPIGEKEAANYLTAMNYALDFAEENRRQMMCAIVDIFYNLYGRDVTKEYINIRHNYAALENHFGQNVWVHRKGATSAREGELGIIPGSQGTKSYIVIGKGNPESFCSCSHGAGRKMSRTKARETLNLEEEKTRLDSKGILHAIRGKQDLDEASSAYKDIDIVMEEQKDLVDIKVELTPLAVIKG